MRTKNPWIFRFRLLIGHGLKKTQKKLLNIIEFTNTSD